jgi:heme-degrading monooxygenase HmoA
MVKEVSVLTIDPKDAAAFERVFVEVAPVLRRQPGYLHDELLRVVENDFEYVLVIHWESVEAHKAFIGSSDFGLLARPWGPFQKQAVVRHCRPVE